MFSPFRITLGNLVFIIVLGMICQISPAQSQKTPSSPVQPTSENDNQQLDAIKKQKKTPEAQAADVRNRLSKAKEGTQEAELLQTELGIIGQVDTTYDQQLATLERMLSLEAKNEHFQKEITGLKAQTSKKQQFSFMDLDRVREELDVESRREKTLSSEINLADSTLRKSIEFVQQQKEKLTQLENTPETEYPVKTKIALEIARLNLELSKETQELRELELRSQKQEMTVHKTRLEFLNRQVGFIEAHAEFNPEELQDQLRRIDKEEFQLNRELSGAKEQQITIKNRLDQARKKLASAGNRRRKTNRG